MKVIAFAASKGGTGKTSLCWNTALYATRKHQVLIADLDPQKSLKDLWESRGELFNPRLITDVKSVATTAKLLKDAGYDRDYFFIDLPGSLMPIIRDACASADLIVLPVQPSAMDLISQEAMFDTIQNMGAGDRTMFVLNRVETRSGGTKDRDDALEYLKIKTRMPIPLISASTAFTRAGWKGQAAWEVNKNKKMEGEIKNLWESIKNALAMTEKSKEQTYEQRLH